MATQRAHCHVFDATRCACPLGKTLEPAQILDESNLRWASLGTLLASTGIACIDGRHRECALGSPGGDAGELLLLLSTIERLCGNELDAASVRAALVDYAAAQGRFYFHTDRATLVGLLARSNSQLGHQDSRHKEIDPVAKFAQATVAERQKLRPLISQPENVGCGHLKGILVDSAKYEVRLQLATTVIEECIEALWEQRLPIQFSVLDGQHQERAVVSFQSCKPIDRGSAIPTPCGRLERGVFVHHGAVLDYLRSRILGILAQSSLRHLELTAMMDRIMAETRRRACEQLATTLDQLAPDLDRYCVRFDSQQQRLEQTLQARWRQDEVLE